MNNSNAELKSSPNNIDSRNKSHQSNNIFLIVFNEIDTQIELLIVRISLASELCIKAQTRDQAISVIGCERLN